MISPRPPVEVEMLAIRSGSESPGRNSAAKDREATAERTNPSPSPVSTSTPTAYVPPCFAATRTSNSKSDALSRRNSSEVPSG